MNTIRNTVNLIGNLGQDPIVKTFGNNNRLARFSVATNERFQGENGEWMDHTTWHNIVAWGKAADLCEQLLKKGSRVVVEGKLVNNSYETAEGEKRYSTSIHLREFMVMDRPERDEK